MCCSSSRLAFLTRLGLGLTSLLGGGSIAMPPTPAAELAPAFRNDYQLQDLGVIPNLPAPYGGVTFQFGNANQLLVAGSASLPESAVYVVPLLRDAQQHVAGFGAPTLWANAPAPEGGSIDAGLTYSPDGTVLFYTTYPDNSIGQIPWGAAGPTKQTVLTSLGIGASVGGVTFVPEGFGGAGRLKILSYDTSTLFDTTVSRDRAPDGRDLGTYTIAPPTVSVALPNGIDSMDYVARGNAGFGEDGALIAEFGSGSVAAYGLDGIGNPIASTRRDFITEMPQVIGTAADPLTGDRFFTTYDFEVPNRNRLWRLQGFAASRARSVSEPGLLLGLIGVLALGLRRRRVDPAYGPL